MGLESEFIAETIFGGFVSKVVNNVWDVSWEAIKKADKNRKGKKQSIQTRIYQIIIDVLNLMTRNQYKGKDIIYNTAEKLLKEFKSGSNYNDTIEHGLKNLLSNIDDSVCQEFMELLCHELGEEKNFDLYKEILLILVNDKGNHTNEELQKIQSKLDYVIQRLDDMNIDTKDIKTEEKHQIQSRTQEYVDKWNANMFLNDFDKRDENAGVNVKLREVYLEEHLPHYIWGDNDEEKPLTDLKELLSEYINEKRDSKMLLIFGQPGIGKSTLITWITVNFVDRINDILVYRVASDLGKIDWKDREVSNRILEELDFHYIDLIGKTLILDGFDEVSIESIRRKDILDSLYEDWIYNKKIKNFSLIITCRENYVERFAFLNCKYIILQPWDEIQIKGFCKIFQEITKSNVSENTIEKLLDNKEILGIPLILYMVLALNISIDKEGSIVDVYDKIFSLEGGIYDRCIDNRKFAESHRIGIVKNQIHQISREIALWMFENEADKASIPQEEYQKICINVKKKNKDEKVDRDVLVGSYFKLVKHCEGVGTEKLCFVHRSIYEYFVAEYIYSSMKEAINLSNEKLACVFGNLLKGNVLCVDYEIIAFLKYKIKNGNINNLFENVNKTFHLMLRSGMTYYANKRFESISVCESVIFANMMEIMHMWDIREIEYDNAICIYLKNNTGFALNLREVNLKGKNLACANLSNANLSGAKLDNANLRCANLKDAFLKFAKLNKANLCGADLKNAQLLGSELVKADLARADLKGADLSGAKLLSANFSGADLRNAKLNMSKLKRTNLSRADLRKAHLSRVELEEMILTGANITDINIDGSKLQNLISVKELLIANDSNEYKDEYWYGKY